VIGSPSCSTANADQNLLACVLGVLGMTEEAQRERVDRVPHLLDERRQRVGVAQRRPLRELR
jgi:hypothetical protein